MTRDNWQRVEEVFYAVVEAPPDRQRQVLEEACAGDEELLAAVQNLLDADQRQNDTIPRAIRGMMVSISEPLNVGQRIGAYEVEREIGHGGMGAVYLAFRADDEFQKRVAIKLLRRGLENPELVARFRQERQILAALDHPYIARLIDGGATDDGRPYLIMDYAEGQPITTYCDELRLPLPERCRIFQKVCEAVAHAHRNLVVHRDLKPGNILVTPDGSPKLLDFGIAKLLDPQEHVDETSTLMGMLTPSYACPEQVRGQKITTASDVYSLGAVLFETLTGHTAYQFANYSPQEIVRVVCEEEPPYGHLPAELDSIVRKAMRKDPRDRYASVDALGEDLFAYASGRPVKARGYSFLYQSSKFVKRHWLAVCAVAIGLVSLMATTIYALGQAQRAERRFAQVRQLASRFLFDFHDSIAQLPGSTEARRQVVRTAIEYLDSLVKEAGGDSLLLSELATAYERVGDVQGNPYYSNLGDTKGAFESYARARALRREISKSAQGMLNFDRDLLNGDLKLADMYSAVGQTEAAVRMLDEALIEFDAHEGPPELRPVAALLHLRRGDVRDKQGRIREAVDDYRKAVALIDAALKEQPTAKLWNDMVAARRRLGERLPAIGDRKGALAELQSALDLAQKTAAQSKGNAEYERNRMTVSLALGTFLLQEGQEAAAQQHFTQALQVAQMLATSDAKNVQASSDLAVVYSRLGDLASYRRQYRDALHSYQQALASAQKAAAADHGNLLYRRDAAYHRLSLGNIAVELPDYELALRELNAGLTAIDELIRADPRDQDNYWLRAQALRDLAAVYAVRRDWDAAIAHNHKALEALGQAPGFRRHEGTVCQQLGSVYQELARTKSPERRTELLREALQWWKRAHAAQLETIKVDGDTAARREELKRIDQQIRLCERGA